MTSESWSRSLIVGCEAVCAFALGILKTSNQQDGRVEALSHISLPPGSGVGIDLVRISRFESLQHNPRFLARIFSPRELEGIGGGVNRAARLAARWAAKEACAKALGCGIGATLGWRDMTITRDPEGKPTIVLAPDVALHHCNPALHLSMSHDGDYAIAIVWIPPSDSSTSKQDSQ